MKWQEQGTANSDRYAVIPRTLCFITHQDHLLLLRGAPTKRIWPNRLNGIGGHIEANEDAYQGALREVREETGLLLQALTQRGVIHVAGQAGQPGVMLVVFCAEALTAQVYPSREGALEWHPLDALPYAEMVEDLPHLLPLLFDAEHPDQMVYGHYASDETGEIQFRFCNR